MRPCCIVNGGCLGVSDGRWRGPATWLLCFSVELLPGGRASSLCPCTREAYFFIPLCFESIENKTGGDSAETETPTSLITLYIYLGAHVWEGGRGLTETQKNRFPAWII